MLTKSNKIQISKKNILNTKCPNNSKIPMGKGQLININKNMKIVYTK